MAWVPEVGQTAKRKEGRDIQETLHSGFQNKIDLHQGKLLCEIYTTALGASEIQNLTVKKY